jgi:hypothetical protein
MPHHIAAARNTLMCYIAETGNSKFVDGKMIFLTGSPELESVNDIKIGRLSGIVNHHVPNYLKANQLPSYSTNCIEDWEEKLDNIVKETIHQPMSLISGIPPWMQMYFDRLQEKSGKKIKEIFPNLSLIVHGGVNFEPYKKKLFDSLGGTIDHIETFPASEGFFAFQDSQEQEGLLLNTHAGIFYEFVEVEDIHQKNPRRYTLADVKLHQQYAMIISTNAGLWAYNIGDTVKFVSLSPYRIVVTGRIKHFISAFGEHVIAEEVEYAMLRAADKYGLAIQEFTVAPYISDNKENSRHQWYVAMEKIPHDLSLFAETIDISLREKNIYYDDLRKGNILACAEVVVLQPDAFVQYMKSIGKLGGQNKVPRLSNDRKIVEALDKYKIVG